MTKCEPFMTFFLSSKYIHIVFFYSTRQLFMTLLISGETNFEQLREVIIICKTIIILERRKIFDKGVKQYGFIKQTLKSPEKTYDSRAIASKSVNLGALVYSTPINYY